VTSADAAASPAPPPDVLVRRLRAAGCVFAEDEAALLTAAATGPVLEDLVARRVAGEPLETVLGWVAFAGLRLAVGPGVFVPRRRTELLARTAATLARAAGPAPVVVEACCGVAPVATFVAHDVPGAVLHAADLDPAATAWAARNLAGRGSVWTGDLLDPVPADLRGRVDVLVANAPYVPHDAVATMPPEAREHEPHVALDGGPDGVDVQRRLLAAAPAWVRPGGHVLVETSRAQVTLTRAACPPGWPVEVLRDDDVDGTVVVAHRPPPTG
jgi:release factor glutamine methyltransferase